jgi:hypothetical protein
VAIRAQLTTAEALATQAASAAKAAGTPVERTDEEKAKRKERVAAAKDALARSAALKGDHVAPARASIKLFLQQLNAPRQPDDQAFTQLIEAPFTAPPKKKTNDRKF